LNERLINRYIIVGRWEGNAMIKVTDHRKGYWAEAPLEYKDLWKLTKTSLWLLYKKSSIGAERRALSDCLKTMANWIDQDKPPVNLLFIDLLAETEYMKERQKKCGRK